jgi:hypothetical protein
MYVYRGNLFAEPLKNLTFSENPKATLIVLILSHWAHVIYDSIFFAAVHLTLSLFFFIKGVHIYIIFHSNIKANLKLHVICGTSLKRYVSIVF